MLENNRKNKYKDTIISRGISLIEIFLFVLAFLGLIFLKPLLTDVSIFPTIERDINRNLLYFVSFPLVLMLAFILAGPRFFKKKYKAVNLAIIILINTAALFAIQIGTALITGFQAQSIAVYVRILFVCTAIAEELMFRVFLISGFQGILVMMLSIRIKMNKVMIHAIGIILSIISASLFALSHTNYWGNGVLMGLTFLTGLIQGILYTFHKETTAIIVAHVILNMLAVGMVIQAL